MAALWCWHVVVVQHDSVAGRCNLKIEILSNQEIGELQLLDTAKFRLRNIAIAPNTVANKMDEPDRP
jgi:hypothetical protein